MEHLMDIDTLSQWLLNYGSIALFVLLALGIFALPIPDETLMVVSGVLMSKGLLPIIPTIVAALLGSMTGMTLSYIVGRTAGHFILHRSLKWLGVTEAHLDKAHTWFETYGAWSLTIGYFVPGIRHFTGVCAGSTDMRYHIFSLYAYPGAIVWAATFVSFGYFFGDYVKEGFNHIVLNLENLGIFLGTAALIGAAFYFHWHRKNNRNKE